MTVTICLTAPYLLAPLLAIGQMVVMTAEIALVVLVVALVLAFVRLVKGPSLPDRVVALDLIATLLVGLIAVSAIENGDVIILRVAMVVALFNFIGTIGFSWYLQQEKSQ